MANWILRKTSIDDVKFFDSETPTQPTEFILRFVVNGVRYHFVLVLNKERILYESLSAFPKGREQVWYERSWEDEDASYTWEPVRPTVYKRDADLGILSAKASEKQLTTEDLPNDMPEELVRQIIEQKHVRISLGHRGSGGREYSLEWEDESSGTQKFIALAGPWIDILENGYIAGLDEIESSMHPLMVHALLKLVFSQTTNPKGAQLIFTTHNPLLLDTGLLRRDQVWFADKDDAGGTFLYPLTDYKPRKKESLVRGYMAGRYGAVPFIPSGLIGEFLSQEDRRRSCAGFLYSRGDRRKKY